MPSIDVIVSSDIQITARIQQLSGMFDVPLKEKLEHRWKAELPLDERPWNIGLIVGPSGAGKTQCARSLFGENVLRSAEELEWTRNSVIDDFDPELSILDISKACSAVGFNTIPSWMKPFHVLSNGEQFRVTLARLLMKNEDILVLDEFTSIVDRQVAKIGSHAVQKYVRRDNQQFVAVSCHYDILEWLQPDWVFQPSTCEFGWRSVQHRPEIKGEITRIGSEAWKLFAPYHYMSANLNPSARCFGLWCDGNLASFIATLSRPISRGKNKGKSIVGATRAVTLPDWQGLGLHHIMIDKLAGCYAAIGRRFHSNPAHPALIQSRAKSPNWNMIRKPGKYKNRSCRSKSSFSTGRSQGTGWGGRPNAVFEYVGQKHHDAHEARRLIESKPV
jgi:hypothetical protein